MSNQSGNFGNRLRRLSGYQKTGAALFALGLLVGALGYFNQHGGLYLGLPLGNLIGDLYPALTVELVGIGVIVLAVDAIYNRRNIEQEKRWLIAQMGSPNHAFALEAVRQLKTRGWIEDGSLRGARLPRANLAKADLAGADLRRADLEEAVLKGADLARANLQGAVLRGADLRDADLDGAVLRGADLVYAQLDGADLISADLHSAGLLYSHLDGATLISANLRLADLGAADLGGAVLRGADLRGADFRGANLNGADLRGALLEGADLEGADLRGADLRGAEVSEGLLAKARALDGAILPDGAANTAEEPSGA